MYDSTLDSSRTSHVTLEIDVSRARTQIPVSRVWMSPCLIELCLMYVWFYIWLSYASCMHESLSNWVNWVMSHVWMSLHLIDLSESCLMYAWISFNWVMSHVWMNLYLIDLIELCPIYPWVSILLNYASWLNEHIFNWCNGVMSHV